MRSQYTRKSRWSSQLVSQPDCDFDVQRFRYAQETMVIIAFQKFGVKGRHKDFPFASPSAQNGSAWPDDCPKNKILNACQQILVVPYRCSWDAASLHVILSCPYMCTPKFACKIKYRMDQAVIQKWIDTLFLHPHALHIMINRHMGICSLNVYGW